MESLSEIAKACGFDACGVVPVDILSRERERLEQCWKVFQWLPAMLTGKIITE